MLDQRPHAPVIFPELSVGRRGSSLEKDGSTTANACYTRDSFLFRTEKQPMPLSLPTLQINRRTTSYVSVGGSHKWLKRILSQKAQVAGKLVAAGDPPDFFDPHGTVVCSNCKVAPCSQFNDFIWRDPWLLNAHALLKGNKSKYTSQLKSCFVHMLHSILHSCWPWHIQPKPPCLPCVT